MRDWNDKGIKAVCVGYNSNDQYLIYDAEKDQCVQLSKARVSDLLFTSTQSIGNLYLTPGNDVLLKYGALSTLKYSESTIAIGEVRNNRRDNKVVGYDIVKTNGDKEFLSIETIHNYSFTNLPKNMYQVFEDGISARFREGGEPLYIRYTSCSEPSEYIDKLKQQLVDVLTKMNEIKPVQFHDVDSDNCVYNFSDVVIDDKDDRVYVEIAMWHDNLPVHAENPLKNGRGKEILPQKKDNLQ